MDHDIQSALHEGDWSRAIDLLIRVAAFSQCNKEQAAAIHQQWRFGTPDPTYPNAEELRLWEAGWENAGPTYPGSNFFAFQGNSNLIPILKNLRARTGVNLKEAVEKMKRWVEEGKLPKRKQGE